MEEAQGIDLGQSFVHLVLRIEMEGSLLTGMTLIKFCFVFVFCLQIGHAFQLAPRHFFFQWSAKFKKDNHIDFETLIVEREEQELDAPEMVSTRQNAFDVMEKNGITFYRVGNGDETWKHKQRLQLLE